MASVHNLGGVDCPVCKRHFSRKDNMLSHMKMRHAGVVEVVMPENPPETPEKSPLSTLETETME